LPHGAIAVAALAHLIQLVNKHNNKSKWNFYNIIWLFKSEFQKLFGSTKNHKKQFNIAPKRVVNIEEPLFGAKYNLF
jgi:hypothetical protein